MLSSRFKFIYKAGMVVLLFLFCFESIGQTNPSYYKFPIVEPGVYKVTNTLIKSLGFEDSEDVAVFGFP